MTDDFSNHDARGRFIAGNNANPSGSNGLRKGFAPWHVRVRLLEEKYDTVAKLMSLFTFDPVTEELTPNDELEKMNPLDAGIIWQLALTIMGNDKRREREAFWDRYEGKPSQRNELAGGNGEALSQSDRDALFSRLLAPVSEGDTDDVESERPK
jgi:hypothetical protein